jgi:hypothetical protein
MKCIEENKQNPRDLSETYRFTIIGDAKENSTQIPLWEKSFTITDTEKIQLSSSEALNVLRKNNAVRVFEQYYTDMFNPYSQG